MTQYTATAARFGIVLLIIVSTGCSIFRHRTNDSAESAAQQTQAEEVTTADGVQAPAPAVTTEAKVDALTSALSQAQGRIEELEAKLAAVQDSLEGTKLAVDNIAGPTTKIKTQAVGEMADDTPQNTTPDPVQKSTAKQKPQNTAEYNESIALFTQAMNLFRSGSFAEAITTFSHFVEKHPEHALAGTAQFYAGECYLSMGEYKLAIPEYQKVITSFSSSPRVPSALVRLSHALNASGDQAEAARFMNLAEKNFPGNPSLDWVPPAPSQAKARAPSATQNSHTKTDTNLKTEAQPHAVNSDDDLRVVPMEMKTTHAQ